MPLFVILFNYGRLSIHLSAFFHKAKLACETLSIFQVNGTLTKHKENAGIHEVAVEDVD